MTFDLMADHPQILDVSNLKARILKTGPQDLDLEKAVIFPDKFNRNLIAYLRVYLIRFCS